MVNNVPEMPMTEASRGNVHRAGEGVGSDMGYSGKLGRGAGVWYLAAMGEKPPIIDVEYVELTRVDGRPMQGPVRKNLAYGVGWLLGAFWEYFGKIVWRFTSPALRMLAALVALVVAGCIIGASVAGVIALADRLLR